MIIAVNVNLFSVKIYDKSVIEQIKNSNILILDS